MCSQLRDDDAVYSGHRAHGHAIAKGAPLERVMAELMGRDDRALPGARRVDAPGRRRARLHGRDRRRRRQRSRSRSAARWPRGCAASDAVAVVFFGDGAVQAGHFNETVNLAALWQLPLDPRLREQRLRGVHAALGAHGGRARERRRRALRPRARDRRRQRRRRGVGGVRALPRLGARGRGPVPARVPDPPPARPLRGRPGQVPRGDRGRRSGRRRTRSCGSSATAIAAGLVRRGRAGRDRGRGRRGGRGGGALRAREPVPAAGADRASMVYADG